MRLQRDGILESGKKGKGKKRTDGELARVGRSEGDGQLPKPNGRLRSDGLGRTQAGAIQTFVNVFVPFVNVFVLVFELDQKRGGGGSGAVNWSAMDGLCAVGGEERF